MEPKTIGQIVRVDGNGIEVLLVPNILGDRGSEAPYRPGQLGSYVSVPLVRGRVLGFVVGMSREETHQAESDAPILIEVQLVGTMEKGRFSCGINEYPVIGDTVIAATSEDFDLVFGTVDKIADGAEHPRSFTLGRFAMNTDFEVKVLGKEFFSKHAAIMGNSGSGKSCTTARVLQEISRMAGAQIVVFDLHGEYRAAFCDDKGKINPNVTHLGRNDLILPYWLLRYEELEQLFVDFSNPMNVDSQTTFLRMALQKLKSETAEEMGLQSEVTIDTPIYFDLAQLKTYAENLNDARFVTNTDRFAFVNIALRNRSREEQERAMIRRRCDFHEGEPEGETIHPLYHGRLVGLVNRIDTRFNDRRYDFVLKPIEHAQGSPYFGSELSSMHSPAELSNVLVHVLNLLMGRGRSASNMTILDLSGIPFDMVDICVALVTHLMFEFNFWSSPAKRHPTLLVYEEAHNYIPRKPVGRNFARTAVEKVAKEGRKYGVSALIISQRPAEVSETVLAQCNNMIILRMNNPEDQAYVTRIVSDQFANLIRVLPMMRPGEGFVIGDSVLMPMRTLIYLPDQLPQSGDFDFFKHWSTPREAHFTNEVVDAWWHQERAAITSDS